MAPSRKKDPGEKFPWHSLANSGVGHWVQSAPIVRGEFLKLGAEGKEVRGLQEALARYGYGIARTASTTAPTMEVVTAFQRHFRPERVDGVADHSTLTTLKALLASRPSDRGRRALKSNAVIPRVRLFAGREPDNAQRSCAYCPDSAAQPLRKHGELPGVHGVSPIPPTFARKAGATAPAASPPSPHDRPRAPRPAGRAGASRSARTAGINA